MLDLEMTERIILIDKREKVDELYLDNFWY